MFLGHKNFYFGKQPAVLEGSNTVSCKSLECQMFCYIFVYHTYSNLDCQPGGQYIFKVFCTLHICQLNGPFGKGGL